jgi:hypothetical protein
MYHTHMLTGDCSLAKPDKLWRASPWSVASGKAMLLLCAPLLYCSQLTYTPPPPNPANSHIPSSLTISRNVPPQLLSVAFLEAEHSSCRMLPSKRLPILGKWRRKHNTISLSLRSPPSSKLQPATCPHQDSRSKPSSSFTLEQLGQQQLQDDREDDEVEDFMFTVDNATVVSFDMH